MRKQCRLTQCWAVCNRNLPTFGGFDCLASVVEFVAIQRHMRLDLEDFEVSSKHVSSGMGTLRLLEHSKIHDEGFLDVTPT